MNLQESNGLIENQEAIHPEYIAYQAFDSQMSQFGATGHQPLACPDQEVMGQGFQLDQDLLSGKAFLVAFRSCQALLIFLDFDLDPATALVVEVDISQQNRLGIFYLLLVAAAQEQDLFGRQGRNNYPVAPLPIFLATANGNPLNGTAVQVCWDRHPA